MTPQSKRIRTQLARLIETNGQKVLADAHNEIGLLCAEIERLQLLSGHLACGLARVKTRPANESAFIAAVVLDDAKKTYGLEVA